MGFVLSSQFLLCSVIIFTINYQCSLGQDKCYTVDPGVECRERDQPTDQLIRDPDPKYVQVSEYTTHCGLIIVYTHFPVTGYASELQSEQLRMGHKDVYYVKR